MAENAVNEYCAHYAQHGIAYPANIFDETAEGMMCPTYAKFLGAMGATASMSFSGTLLPPPPPPSSPRQGTHRRPPRLPSLQRGCVCELEKHGVWRV